MAKHRNNNERSGQPKNSGDLRNAEGNNRERHSSIPNDLPDTPEDEKKLESDESTINLPDTKDIPGQEFVNAPSLGELADNTIASSDEEGENVFNESSDITRGESNVSKDERHALERTDYMPTRDENNLQRASMDNVDFQGDELNEKGFGEKRGDTVAPDDLDTNTAEDETRTTSMGQGDEENKTYSLGGPDNDALEEDRS